MDGGRLTLEEVIRRAGAEPRFVQRLRDEGLIGATDGEPGDAPAHSIGDVRRVQLIEACVAAGIELDDIAQAHRTGFLTLTPLDLPYYSRWGERSSTTFADEAERWGISIEFLERVRDALGLAPAAPTDSPRTDELEVLPVMSVALQAGFDPEALLGMVRVYGDALRRITRTETQLWHEYVDVPTQRAGATQRQVLEGGEAFGQAVLPLMDRHLLSLYHRMQEIAWTGDLVEHVELSIEEAGLTRRLERPPAIGFVDLSGYTRLTEEHGDEHAAELATTHATLMQRIARGHGGQAVKFLGDGVMFLFNGAAEGVAASLEAVGAVEPAGLPPAHVGLHAGPVVMRDGDVFGRTVNLAARLSGVAGPSEVIVTREVVEEAGDTPVAFDPLGALDLNGVAEPVEAFRAVPA
jgi:class 3 adenylate cyclase